MSLNLILPFALALYTLSAVNGSPVLYPNIFFNDPNNQPQIPTDICSLTPNFGYIGSSKFVEDCEHLDTFPILPMPSGQKYGTHPRVCCPKVSDKAICFPTDPWCPTFVKPTPPTPSQDETTEDFGDYEEETRRPIYIPPSPPKISDEDCSLYGNTTQCVNLKDCPGIFRQPSNPSQNKYTDYARVCGWDKQDKAVKVCCPADEVQDKSLREVVEPRFPEYPCHDKVKQCQRWKNNDGCRTDMDFVIDPDEPQDSGRADSQFMFDFMTGTCMETCDLCGDKGCRDEHPDCVDWARQGYCVTTPDFMVHTCRESCGVCGFLSTDDYKEQTVGENAYTDFRSSKFDCGRYKKLSEVNPKEKEEELIEINGEEDEYRDDFDYDIRLANKDITKLTNESDNSVDEDEDVFFSNEGGNKFCGATLFSDRWIVTASHCYDNLGDFSKVRINTIRDNTPFKEIIEIKRIYKHPKYVYPNLYNDIALLELGRRVDYNWDKYGDSPMCIDRVGQNEGKVATIQGYGITENGTKGDLLEANVTVISNTKCKETLTFNTTGQNNGNTIRTRINNSLPKGLNDKMFCTQGEENEQGVVRGSCKGDSGGPLFVERDDGRQMLVGIVSGGIGCGAGYPNWYTKVAFFTPWIECIIDNSRKYKHNKVKIDQACFDVADEADLSTPDDYIFENIG